LLVADVQLVTQVCSVMTVKFTDQGVADFFDRMVDAGLQPAQFGRIWLHTHPGHSALPSATDEATFGRVFSAASYAVMAIISVKGQRYARLQLNHGFSASLGIPIEIDYTTPFAGSDFAGWNQEYDRNVTVEEIRWPDWKTLPHQDDFGDEAFGKLQDAGRDDNLADLLGDFSRWEPIALSANRS
jgi:proteasome lid subunit RPN8/RPN11